MNLRKDISTVMSERVSGSAALPRVRRSIENITTRWRYLRRSNELLWSRTEAQRCIHLKHLPRVTKRGRIYSDVTLGHVTGDLALTCTDADPEVAIPVRRCSTGLMLRGKYPAADKRRASRSYPARPRPWRRKRPNTMPKRYFVYGTM